jgi:hypothetical protein
MMIDFRLNAVVPWSRDFVGCKAQIGMVAAARRFFRLEEGWSFDVHA